MWNYTVELFEYIHFSSNVEISETVKNGGGTTYTVTSISDSAFMHNFGFKSIIIPKTVTSIGENAFSSCNDLEEIIVKERNKNYSSVDGVLFNYDKTELVWYPENKEGTMNQYKITMIASVNNKPVYENIQLNDIVLKIIINNIRAGDK